MRRRRHGFLDARVGVVAPRFAGRPEQLRAWMVNEVAGLVVRQADGQPRYTADGERTGPLV